MNIREIKEYEEKFLVDYDNEGEFIVKTARANIVICTAKEIDNKIEELDNRNYDFKVYMKVEIKYKTKENELIDIEDYGCRYCTPTISRSLHDIETEIIHDYLEKYTDINNYCDIEEIKIILKKIEVEIHLTTCEFCNTEFENTDDYWGCGCKNCCSNVCLDCLTDTEDYGRLCSDCLKEVEEELQD